MKKENKFSRFSVWVTFGLILYIVFTYQDTDTFQSVMKFLFNPGSEYTLPVFWQENRIFLSAMVLLLLILYMLPTFNTFKKSIQLYQNSTATEKKPTVSILQACYTYQQDKVTCMTAWIIDMCRQGIVSLQYDKTMDPSERWAVHKIKDHNIEYQNKALMDILFRENDTVRMKAFMHDPNPSVEETTDTLYASIQEKYRLFFVERQSTLPVWIVLFFLLAEIPFYMASTGENIPATLPITLFAIALFIIPVYVLCKFLPAFFNGPKVTAYSMFVFSILFSCFGLWMLYSETHTLSYWTTAFFPSITAAILVLIYQSPLLQKNNRLLSQILGYRKYLAKDGYVVQEEDLPWTLALGVHSDIFDNAFQYVNTPIPQWIQNHTKEDTQTLMKALHRTLQIAVNEAVNGDRDDDMRLDNDLDHVSKEF